MLRGLKSVLVSLVHNVFRGERQRTICLSGLSLEIVFLNLYFEGYLLWVGSCAFRIPLRILHFFFFILFLICLLFAENAQESQAP